MLILRSTVMVLLYLHHSKAQECLSPQTIDFNAQTALCNQPFFLNLLPKTAENELLDNVCLTFLPLPDDPNTLLVFTSYVYCDGSSYVQSFVDTEIGLGLKMLANPFVTYNDYFVGYAGCDTYVGYRCSVFGDLMPPFVFGASPSCQPIGLSCLRKVDEVIRNAGLPEQDMYVLPMKLPNRCVTRAACTLPPNPFFNKLGPSVGLID